jgi:cysteine desulfurase
VKLPIYLDYNATTPHAPEVIAAMRPFLEEHFGNPSSSHAYGRINRQAVEQARSQVARLINAKPAEVIFTSGGTEANNHAILGVAGVKGAHAITTQIEHPAVTEVCEALRSDGVAISYVPVDGEGRVDPEDVRRAIRPETGLISVMHANNEVGTVQPIEEIGKLARERRILFHTDAAQSAGKVPVDVESLKVDLLSLAGHKLYAPKGVGALYVREGTQLNRFLLGAGQERGRRAGTENVLEIVGLGAACEIAAANLGTNASHMRQMRDAFEHGIRARVGEVRINGSLDHRLPNTSSLSFRGLTADELIREIEEHVALSAGAACHSGEVRVSAVIKALRVPEEWAKGTVRISTGRMTNVEEINLAIEVVAAAVTRIRRVQELS